MTNLEKAFRKMKADVKIKNGRAHRGGGYNVDVKKGKFLFDLGDTAAKVTILEADSIDRHVLLNVNRTITKRTRDGGERKEIVNDKWLCGHDERDWFVASAKGVNIWEAKQSLKPKEVQAAELVLKPKKRQKRKNEAFKRQGEWFFIPAPELQIPAGELTFKDEPISRGRGSKPHIVEEVYRTGGREVWVIDGRVATDQEYRESKDKARFTRRTADATVYGRGTVKHGDHKTLILETWHKILMNSEASNSTGSEARLIFLD